MKKQMKKLLAGCLAWVMALSLMPAAAVAAGTEVADAAVVSTAADQIKLNAFPGMLPAGEKKVYMEVSGAEIGRIYQGKGDVIVLKDQDREIGRSASLKVTHDWKDEMHLCGDVILTEPIKKGQYYQVWLNGVQVQNVGGVRYCYGQEGLYTSNEAVPMAGYSPEAGKYGFWGNMGEFPVRAVIANGSGRGHFVIKDRYTETVVLTGATVRGAQSPWTNCHSYEYSFKTSDFEGLDGGEYALWFADDNGMSGRVANLGGYLRDQVSTEEPALYSGLRTGDRTMEVIYHLASAYNIPRNELEKLKTMTLTNETQTFRVTDYTGKFIFVEGLAPTYRVVLQLDKPLVAGDYKLYMNDALMSEHIEVRDDHDAFIWDADLREGVVRLDNLKMDGAYTAKLFLRDTCVTPKGFPMEYVNDGLHEYDLFFDPAVAVNLKPEAYTIRVYRNGIFMDEYYTNLPDNHIFINLFTDVKEEDYFYEPVKWAIENNVTSGVGNGQFGPDLKCTRAQIVTFLWNSHGQPDPVATSSPFSDVSEDAWYFKPIMWAVENDITSGIGNGQFGPELTCTRAQAMTFLWKDAGRPVVGGEMTFSDVHEDDWFYMPVKWAVANKITSGVGGGRFGSEDDCLRAQIVTFMYRVA